MVNSMELGKWFVLMHENGINESSFKYVFEVRFLMYVFHSLTYNLTYSLTYSTYFEVQLNYSTYNSLLLSYPYLTLFVSIYKCYTDQQISQLPWTFVLVYNKERAMREKLTEGNLHWIVELSFQSHQGVV